MNFHLIFCDIKRDITILQKIIREVALDDVAAVSATDDEVLNSSRRIYLHDMPEYGLTADFNHRLGTEIALLTDPRTHAPCKNYGYHDLLFALSLAAFIVRRSCGTFER
jgi:hypothetical protein